MKNPVLLYKAAWAFLKVRTSSKPQRRKRNGMGGMGSDPVSNPGKEPSGSCVSLKDDMAPVPRGQTTPDLLPAKVRG